ncbi:MAG TPA: hypothetical protein VGH74_12880, partial [Planctomycetaceae bacterium]
MPDPAMKLADLSTAQLFDKLNDPNLIVRTTVTNELTQRKDFVATLRMQMKNAADKGPHLPVHLIWAALRAGELTSTEFLKPYWHDSVVRANWARAVTELPRWKNAVEDDVMGLLADIAPMVRRVAAEALGQHADASHIAPLVKLWSETPPQDTLLVHAVKIALRNQLKLENGFERLANLSLSKDDRTRIIDIALAVPTEAAARFAFDYARDNDVSAETLARFLPHVARHIGEGGLNDVAQFVQTKYRGNVAQQLPLFQAVYTGLSQKGQALQADSALGQWGATLANAVLDPQSGRAAPWSVHPVDNASSSQPFQNPWGIRKRHCADGRRGVEFFDSIVHGEQLTGILRSRAFVIPESLSFWLCGHNGEPSTNPEPVNHVRLKLADGANRGEVIAREIPPRNDTAQKITWDLQKWAGRQGVLEVVDADSGPAFAWLGVSRFEPPVVGQPSPDFANDDREITLAVNLVEQLKLTEQMPRIIALLADRDTALSVRAAAVPAVMRVDSAAGEAVLEKLIVDPTEPAALRSQAGAALGGVNAPAARAALMAAFVGAASSLEQGLALALAGTPE